MVAFHCAPKRRITSVRSSLRHFTRRGEIEEAARQRLFHFVAVSIMFAARLPGKIAMITPGFRRGAQVEKVPRQESTTVAMSQAHGGSRPRVLRQSVARTRVCL